MLDENHSSIDYSIFASNKFSLDSFLASSFIPSSLNESSIDEITQHLDKLKERSKRDALRLISTSFDTLSGTAEYLDAFNKTQLPAIHSNIKSITESIHAFQSSFHNILISMQYSKYVPAKSSLLSSTQPLSDNDWFEKRADFEALNGLLENFALFSQDNDRYLVVKCAGIEEISNPVLHAHAPDSCMFFLCNDVLLVGFPSKTVQEKVAVQTCFNLMDIQYESYGNELRISASPKCTYEYQFAAVDFLTAFLEILQSTKLLHKKSIIQYLYSIIKNRFLDEKEEINGFISENKNVEVFKRKNLSKAANQPDIFTRENPLDWTLSKLNYIYKQIVNIEEYTLQIDYDKAISAAIGAKLSLYNLEISVAEVPSGKIAFTPLIQSIKDFLKSKVDHLFTELSGSFVKSQHSRAKTALNIKRIIKLGYTEQIRMLFLQYRSDFIKTKTCEILFTSNSIQNYVRTFSIITFSVIRNTCFIFTEVFQRDDYSYLFEWCNNSLVEFVFKVKRHLFDEEHPFPSLCESVKITYDICSVKMNQTGIYLLPFLENYFVPGILYSLQKEQERIVHLIKHTLLEESLENPDTEIFELLASVCSKELVSLLVSQILQGAKPFKSACLIFAEINAFLQGLILAVPVDMSGIIPNSLFKICTCFFEVLGEEERNIFESLLCAQIFFSNIFPSYQLLLENAFSHSFPSLSSFTVDFLEPFIFQTLKPKSRNLLVPLIAEQLTSTDYYFSDDVFIAADIKRPSRPMVYFCETINFFYQLEKFDLLNELFELIDFTHIAFTNKGIHHFITDLYYLQNIATPESVMDAIYFCYGYYKKNFSNSPVIDNEWNQEEFYDKYSEFLQSTN